MSDKVAIYLAIIDVILEWLDKEIEDNNITDEEILESRKERKEKIQRFKDNS
jgi:hypothetical protein